MTAPFRSSAIEGEAPHCLGGLGHCPEISQPSRSIPQPYARELRDRELTAAGAILRLPARSRVNSGQTGLAVGVGNLVSSIT